VAEIVRERAEVAGVLLERPGMLTLAKDSLAEQGVADRCRLVEGDFFSSVPAGGDVYVLKSVLHDWDDERCVAILRNRRAAMHAAARLLILELTHPERMTHSPELVSAALLDLIMLAYAGGRERTEAEFAALLDQAELRPAGTTALTAGPRVLEAVAV
jgi:hypothetical protein